MAFGFMNYDKAGPGVPKNAPKKSGFKLFFELYFRKFWKLISLSLLTFVFSIPIVTIGPATAGMTRVLRNYTIEKNAYLFYDFWKGFKDNWKQSFLVSLIDAVLIVAFYAAITVYPQMANNSEYSILFYALCIISLSVFITIFIMNFYIYTMMVSTELKLKYIIKNAYVLTFAALKKNIITFLVVFVVVAALIMGSLYFPLVVLLVPLWSVSFLGFVIVFNTYPVVEQYVINPYYEKRGESNPQYDYLKPLDDDDNVFTDNGGKDMPISGKGNGGKNKTIS